MRSHFRSEGVAELEKPTTVIPAKAGIQTPKASCCSLQLRAGQARLQHPQKHGFARLKHRMTTIFEFRDTLERGNENNQLYFLGRNLF